MCNCSNGPQSPNIFPTYGVHNPPGFSPCASPDCLYQRGPGDPSDPLFPLYWSAKWTMYRVFNNYSDNMPPYDGKPPAALKEGEDYQVSYGETYYDSTWRGPNGEQGAMMEYYKDYSLPIFPIANNFSSAFVSLGNTAYFITYDHDRPAGMPPICLFSPLNHPPNRDFVKHLPYSFSDSKQLDNKIQGYSLWADPDGGPPIQTGASPDRTADKGILFGYAFESEYKPDAVNKEAEPYRHPQSFYFSGFPGDPPNAPIVSQNYTEFAMIKPDPVKIWGQVYRLLAEHPCPTCNLFQPEGLKGSIRERPDWSGPRDR